MRFLRPAVSLLVVATLSFGIVYPLLVTGIAQLAFPAQAHGSLLHRGTTLIGSKLIGQHFSGDQYFWGRPSATAPQPDNGAASGGSNFGPLNPALLDQADVNLKALHAAGAGGEAGAGNPAVPVDLVTASASGLDPEISTAAAEFQAARIARARGMTPGAVEALIARLKAQPLLGVVGEPRVNVLELNMALDGAGNE